VTVDVLAEAGIAGDDERMQTGRSDVADQAWAAVADRDLRSLQHIGQRLLVEEGLAGRD
jgi:hypothetical protein